MKETFMRSVGTFMNDTFKLKNNKKIVREKYKTHLKVPSWNQVMYGEKSLDVFEVKVRNNLPYHSISSDNLKGFKKCKFAVRKKMYFYLLSFCY